MSEIYRRIRERRLELGLTVEDLAKKMGYKDKSSISKIENGKADIPQSKVEAFAKALDTTTAYLLGVDEEKDPAAPGEVSEADLKFALFGGNATDQQLDEVRRFAQFIKERDAK